MDFSNTKDKVNYCLINGNNCLDDIAKEFIQKVSQLCDKKGKKVTLTSKQTKYLGVCLETVLKYHPVLKESGLDRMRRKKEMLSRKSIFSTKKVRSSRAAI